MSQRILIVEDEPNIAKLIKLNLELEGYEIDIVEDGLQAIEKVESAHFDLMILDLMLPKLNGMKVLQKIRLSHSNLPIIIASAKDSSSDRIEGLRAGADDYLNKPFQIEELILRVKNLISRSEKAHKSDLKEYTFGKNKINFHQYTASGKSGEFRLTKKETLLLKLLIDNENEVVSRETMFKNIWGYDVYPSTRTIDNFILNLRKHFEEDPKHPKHFLSVRGVGYKFVS